MRKSPSIKRILATWVMVIGVPVFAPQSAQPVLAQDIGSEILDGHCAVMCSERFWQQTTEWQLKRLMAVGALDTVDHANKTPLHWAAAYSNSPLLLELILEDDPTLVRKRDNHARVPLHFAGGFADNPMVARVLLDFAVVIAAREVTTTAHEVLSMARAPSASTLSLLAQDGTPIEVARQALTAAHDALIASRDALLTSSQGSIESESAASRAEIAAQGALAAVGRQDEQSLSDNDLVVAHKALIEARAGLLATSGQDDNEDRSEYHIEEALINARDQYGETPLHWAAAIGANSEMIEFLLAAGAWIDVQANGGLTPLHAAATGILPSLTTLLESGAYVNIRDDLGRTPLHRAAQYAGRIPLHKAAQYADDAAEVVDDAAEVVRLLIDHGADINGRDERDNTPLHFAARYSSSPEAVAALIAAGGDINARNGLKQTPCGVVFANPNPAIYQLLDRECNPLRAGSASTSQ